MRFFEPSRKAVEALLQAASLPTDDLPASLDHFLGCGDPAAPDGVVGVEIFEGEALLRSLVVAPAARGRGLGKDLVAAAERLAHQQGRKNIFLLTDTAEDFFAKLGYRRVDRQTATASIRATRQFTELCPASAALMVKELGPSGS